MAISWSSKRKFYYGGSVALVLVVIFSFAFFNFFYKAPMCSDGKKNGDETGVDCGGSCTNLCSGDTIMPIIYWSKAFNISGNVYNIAAYVENPNLNSSNPKATYEFKIFDDKNILLGSRKGETFIPQNKKFIVFEPGFVITNKKPKYVEFDFTSFSPWQKNTAKEADLNVKYSPLSGTSTAPRIDGTISNASQKSVDSLELVALVQDSQENAVAVSRTFVDNLAKGTSQDFVFTWPKPFDLGVESCTSPLDITLALDRSGSMQSEGANPPEPFSTVKSTAGDFVKALSDNDKVSVVSFGNTAREEISLSSDLQSVLNTISNLFLSTTTLEQTDITDSLVLASQELTVSDKGDAKKAIILLTDGVPTSPTKTGENDYPKTSATRVAGEINQDGLISLYTIGLGKDVSESFLKSLVSDDSHYFFAPTKNDLSAIYKNISSSLCTKKPSVVNIIYRILPQ